MILEAVMTISFAMIHTLILLMPDGYGLPDWGVHAVELISKAMIVFPVDVWLIVIGNIAFWLTAQLAWAVIEWIYKKIPGIN